MKKTRRSGQVGDIIRAELSNIISRELRDPDIGFATIVHVEVSTDMMVAHVHTSVIGDEAAQQRSVAALNKAKSRIRRLLSQRVELRTTPELDFRIDQTALRAETIERTLRDIKENEVPSNDDNE